MADGSDMAEDGFVQIGHSRFGPIMVMAVRDTADPDDLISFRYAGARVLRIGSRMEQIVELHRNDPAVRVECHARRDRVVTAMDIGKEGFQPVGDIL